mmetsp:Transcript_20037/g.36181  ORF Transcript_20037/g.36181 Transcript_20037/m.36181 type:complete len:253 (+) Transcript_20037:84-842(+)
MPATRLQWWIRKLCRCRCWRGMRLGVARQADLLDAEPRSDELAEVMLEQPPAPLLSDSEGLAQSAALASDELRQPHPTGEHELGSVEAERFDRQVTGEWLLRRHAEALQASEREIAATQQALLRLAERRRAQHQAQDAPPQAPVQTQQQMPEQLEREVEVAFLMSVLPPERWSYQYIHQEGDAECRICLEEYVCDDEIVRLPCMHYAHAQCLEKWLRRSACCPVCRTSLREVTMLSEFQAEMLESPLSRDVS